MYLDKSSTPAEGFGTMIRSRDVCGVFVLTSVSEPKIPVLVLALCGTKGRLGNLVTPFCHRRHLWVSGLRIITLTFKMETSWVVMQLFTMPTISSQRGT